ncbi:MAG: hypothetical protein U0R24_00855 [Solirubrobacterales bacterium]
MHDKNLGVVEAGVAASMHKRMGMPILKSLMGDEDAAIFIGDLVADAAAPWFDDYLIRVLLDRGVSVDLRIAAAETLASILECRRALPALREAAGQAGGLLATVAKREAAYLEAKAG